MRAIEIISKKLNTIDEQIVGWLSDERLALGEHDFTKAALCAEQRHCLVYTRLWLEDLLSEIRNAAPAAEAGTLLTPHAGGTGPIALASGEHRM